jgi:DNA-binding PadR family transcriptional regulator
MQSSTRDPRRHLPLRPSAFAVLAALADGPLPGVDVLDAVNATVAGAPILGPGTLYRLLKELREDQLVARVEATAAVADERQALHQLTTFGRAVLRAEAARLRRTLELADGRAGSGGRA